MKKILTFALAIFLFSTFVVIVVILFLNSKNKQSSEEEMQNAFAWAIFQATEVEIKNPFLGMDEAHKQWSIYAGTEKIAFSQCLDWDDHAYKQYLEIFLREDKIVLQQYDFEFSTESNTGSKYSIKYREFKNSGDFFEKFGIFFEDIRNNGNDSDSYVSLTLSDYYPAYSWKNWQMSLNDDKEGNIYESN